MKQKTVVNITIVLLLIGGMFFSIIAGTTHDKDWLLLVHMLHGAFITGLAMLAWRAPR